MQAKVTLTATRRGDIHIYLTSPAGTRSTLLAQRPMDNSRSGFQNWPFMTVHSWGENPNGEWKIEIHNEGRYYSKFSVKPNEKVLTLIFYFYFTFFLLKLHIVSSGLPHSLFGMLS